MTNLTITATQRMNSLITDKSIENLWDGVNSIVADLTEEGFSKEDISLYIIKKTSMIVNRSIA